MGSVAIIILAAVIFFFAFFQVKTVEVMGSEHYSEDELKEAILKGPLTSNTIFAPRFYSKNAEELKDDFVEGMFGCGTPFKICSASAMIFTLSAT